MRAPGWFLLGALFGCATAPAVRGPHAEGHETQSSGRKHALAKERCGWDAGATLEDHGPVGVLRRGGSGCLVWFTEEGTAEDRAFIGRGKVLRIIELPGDPLPAVLIERTRSDTASADVPALELELMRPRIGSQRIALVAPSPRVTLVGDRPTCDSVSIRARTCDGTLWMEERSCLGETPIHQFRGWKPGEPGAYHLREDSPACAGGPGELWFERGVQAQVTEPLTPGETLKPPPPPGPPSAVGSKLIGLFPGKVQKPSAFAAFEVQRSDLKGGVEQDLDLYILDAATKAWRRHTSVTLARGPFERDCRPSAVLSNLGALDVRACIDGKAVQSQLPSPALQAEPGAKAALSQLGSPTTRCHAMGGKYVCLDQARDGSAVGWIVSPFGSPRGIPGLRQLQLLDGPFLEGDRVRFVGWDLSVPGEVVKWVEAPLAFAPEDRTGQLILEPLIPPAGMVTEVHRLRRGATFVTRSTCSEWGAARPGALLFPRGGGRARPEVLVVDSGPILDLGRHLLVWSEVQVGSDGSGDVPVHLPEGATFFEGTGNGAYVIHRLEKIDLVTKQRQRLAWGTHSPRTAGAGRFVVFAKTLERVEATEEDLTDRTLHEVRVWDLQTGKTVLLGTSRGPVRARAEDGEIQVRLESPRGARVMAVNGSSGRVRELAGKTDVEPTPLFPKEASQEVSASPHIWQTPAGEAILVASTGQPSTPQAGGCGLQGVMWIDGAFISDQGVSAWPEDLEVLDFEVPRATGR